MRRYIIQRLLGIVPVLIIMTLMIFALMRLMPGDPIITAVGPLATEETIQALREAYGLDKPLHVQYLTWLRRMAHGDLGISVQTGEPVSKMIRDRIMVTLTLTFTAALVSLMVALPVGIISAYKQYTLLDYIFTIFATIGVAIPDFFAAIVLILIFGVTFRVLPIAGFVNPLSNLIDGLKHLVMPGISLGLIYTALISRMMRSSMLDVLGEDYIRTARAKGLREITVALGHAAKNAMLPVVTTVAINLARLLGGSVIVEEVFALPGIGRLLVRGVLQRDFPVIQGVTLLIGLIFLASSLVADIVYVYLDPRIKY